MPPWCRFGADMVDATEEPNQAKYAELFADELNTCDDYGLQLVDVLDALASLGLKLVRDDSGDATIAYGAHFLPEN